MKAGDLKLDINRYKIAAMIRKIPTLGFENTVSAHEIENRINI